MFLPIVWDDDQDPHGNVASIARHGLTIEDVEAVLARPAVEGMSRRCGLPCRFGYTPSGEYVMVIYRELDVDVPYPVTAYEVPHP
jgi:hypothetical protein